MGSREKFSNVTGGGTTFASLANRCVNVDLSIIETDDPVSNKNDSGVPNTLTLIKIRVLEAPVM